MFSAFALRRVPVVVTLPFFLIPASLCVNLEGIADALCSVRGRDPVSEFSPTNSLES